MQHAANHYQDDTVAQKLLSSWFGIDYDNDEQDIAEDSLSAWASFRSTANSLTWFLETGNYERHSTDRPYIFCDGNFGDEYGWDAVATENEIELEEDDPEDGVYNPSIWDVYKSSKDTEYSKLFWVEPLRRIYLSDK